MKFRSAFMILAAAALGCCSHGGPRPIASGERYAGSGPFEEVYRLDAGDKVRVTVYNEPQLSGDFQVSSEGKLSLPLIGDVAVAGKTTMQAAEAIRTPLADGYVRDPRVSLEVSTYRPFFILGEVKSPGQYPYMSGLTALNAIATAQGFTPRAQKKTVLIRRFGEHLEQAYVLTPDLRILPGDTIRLSERFF